jgi:hypothetical protein
MRARWAEYRRKAAFHAERESFLTRWEQSAAYSSKYPDGPPLDSRSAMVNIDEYNARVAKERNDPRAVARWRELWERERKNAALGAARHARLKQEYLDRFW